MITSKCTLTTGNTHVAGCEVMVLSHYFSKYDSVSNAGSNDITLLFSSNAVSNY